MSEKTRIITNLIIFFVLTSNNIQAQLQNLNFDRYSLSDGLSQTYIYSIYQDSEGFMWFGTYDGLNRFDGYNFKIYKTEEDNPNSIGSNAIRCIIEDKSGNIWIGTEAGGLNKYDKNKDAFIRYKYDLHNPKSIADNTVSALFEDSEGMIWIGATGAGLNMFDPSTEEFHLYQYPTDTLFFENNAIMSICEDNEHRIWVGTWGGGIKEFDRINEKFIDHDLSINSNVLSDNDTHNRLQKIWAVYFDSKNNLWVGSDGDGLFRYDYAQKKFINYRNDPANSYSINNDMIVCIFEDKTGRLWLGTDGGGLNLYNRENDTFTSFQNQIDDPNSLTHNVALNRYAVDY